jgi:Methyltransferase domain
MATGPFAPPRQHTQVFTILSRPAQRDGGIVGSPLRASRTDAAAPSLWSTFWQEFCLEDQLHERCHVPGDGRAVVDQHWAQFARKLPPRAHVVDLGCGAGIAGRVLLGQRADLQITGVDFANVPVLDVPNLTIHRGTPIEAMPFNDGCFDAAISLFGVEYAKIEEAGRELARVLKPGAPFSFLVHHRESEIVCEGSMRRRALRELLSGNMRTAFLSGRATQVAQCRQSLRLRYPAEPMVNLVSDHFRLNIGRSRAERQALWQKLASDVEPEVALLSLLDKCAKSAAEVGCWLIYLLTSMASVSVSVLRRRSGEPIAWRVSGLR